MKQRPPSIKSLGLRMPCILTVSSCAVAVAGKGRPTIFLHVDLNVYISNSIASFAHAIYTYRNLLHINIMLYIAMQGCVRYSLKSFV